jgi:hypothetical protein
LALAQEGLDPVSVQARGPVGLRPAEVAAALAVLDSGVLAGSAGWEMLLSKATLGQFSLAFIQFGSNRVANFVKRFDRVDFRKS